MSKKRPKSLESKLSVDAIQTRSLSVVDESGTERIQLSCFPNGNSASLAAIQMYGADGRTVVVIEVDAQGNSNITLFDKQNAPGASIGVNSNDGNGITVADSEGKPVIMIGMPANDSHDPLGPRPHVMAIDEAGNRTWTPFSGVRAIPSTLKDGK